MNIQVSITSGTYSDHDFQFYFKCSNEHESFVNQLNELIDMAYQKFHKVNISVSTIDDDDKNRNYVWYSIEEENVYNMVKVFVVRKRLEVVYANVEQRYSINELATIVQKEIAERLKQSSLLDQVA